MKEPITGRRHLVRGALALPLAQRMGLAPLASTVASAMAGVAVTSSALAATPACVGPADPTPPQTAGPFYTPDSPERDSLVQPDMAGTLLLLSGLVLGTDCRPVPRAVLEFWQADSAGRYDNEGYRLRGHLRADDRGHWRLQTILPGIYPGRTRHIHVRVHRDRRPPLTTQLYFPGEVRNQADGLFSPALLVAVAGDATPAAGAGGGPAMTASFDFVLAA
jgi:protocatechuate 3,4-dioxygenase beta subunit